MPTVNQDFPSAPIGRRGSEAIVFGMLAALEPTNAAGIPGAAVSAASARMGDGLSTYEDGIISAANELAAQAGVVAGMTARAAAHCPFKELKPCFPMLLPIFFHWEYGQIFTVNSRFSKNIAAI